MPAVEVVSGDLVGSDGVNFTTGSNLTSAMRPLVSLIEGSRDAEGVSGDGNCSTEPRIER